MDAPSSDCKTSAYLTPMIIVLVLFVGALGFILWYYFAKLKPRLNMLVYEKTGNIGFKDSTGTQLLLQPADRAASTGQSGRISIVNTPAKSNLDFSLYTTPIPGNTKQQVQMMIANKQGSAVIPLNV